MSLPMSPTPKCLQKSRYFFLYFFLYLYPLHRVLCPLLFPPLFSTLPNLSLNLPSYLSPLVCFALCPFLSSWFCSHTHSLTPVSLPCSCIYFPLIFCIMSALLYVYVWAHIHMGDKRRPKGVHAVREEPRGWICSLLLWLSVGSFWFSCLQWGQWSNKHLGLRSTGLMMKDLDSYD